MICINNTLYMDKIFLFKSQYFSILGTSIWVRQILIYQRRIIDNLESKKDSLLARFPKLNLKKPAILEKS